MRNQSPSSFLVFMRNFVAALTIALCVGWILGASPGMGPGAPRAETRPVDPHANLGPDVVVMKELVKEYEAVPFDHKGHAVMAEMWQGCETCHHQTPEVTAQRAGAPLVDRTNKTDSKNYPACKSCHVIEGLDTEIGMPNLKGAYHRQCLNCHREWMNDNACEVCHARLDGAKTTTARPAPSKSDIVGRMHPPIPEPDVLTYKARFTPAVGENIVFRHKEHTHTYGLRCVYCHQKDSCASCHSEGAAKVSHNPMKHGRTWRESHMPCVNCHKEEQERCNRCHYKDDHPVPSPFDHRNTGQELDDDHREIGCTACHVTLRSAKQLKCGDAKCHPKNPGIAFPEHRPGPIATTRPAILTQSAPGPSKGIAR